MLIILVTLEVLETLGVLLRNLCLGVNSTPPRNLIYPSRNQSPSPLLRLHFPNMVAKL